MKSPIALIIVALLAAGPLMADSTDSSSVGRARVGVEETNTVSLKLSDVSQRALVHNLDIQNANQDVAGALGNEQSSRAPYDLVARAEGRYQDAAGAVDELAFGVTPGSIIDQRTLTTSAGFSQRIRPTGGRLDLDVANNRMQSDSPTALYGTRYEPSISLDVNQPLAQGRSIDADRRQEKLMKLNSDVAKSRMELVRMDVLQAVQHSYWDLVYALGRETIARDSLNLAVTQLDHNRVLVERGKLASVELRANEAAVESRKEDVLLALQDISAAENKLKGLITDRPDDPLWSSRLIPADAPQHQPVPVNLVQAMNEAFIKRPELAQIRSRLEQAGVDRAYFQDQAKPQIDFFATFTKTGLSGEEPLAQVPSVNVGGIGQGFDALGAQSQHTIEGGLRFRFPLQNSAAKGGMKAAEARQIAWSQRERQTMQNIQVEVRDTLQELDTAEQRMQATEASRKASEAQYEGEQERFNSGLSTNFLVLQRQSDLTEARGNELKAVTDYNKALADLARATGATPNS